MFCAGQWAGHAGLVALELETGFGQDVDVVGLGRYGAGFGDHLGPAGCGGVVGEGVEEQVDQGGLDRRWFGGAGVGLAEGFGPAVGGASGDGALR